MAEKETIMGLKLKIDLECPKCCKKVKKLLCKFPQIRDQVYNLKDNIVTIVVVCCNPEKLRDKLCCKGCGIIKSIEIVEPHKPKPSPPQKPVKSKESEKHKEKTPPPPQPQPEPPPPAPPAEPVCPPVPAPVCPLAPPPMAVPIGVCCVPCSEGRPGGPCFDGYGGPPQCYAWYYVRPVYYSYGGGRPCYVSRCDEYFCDDNTSACTIM